MTARKTTKGTSARKPAQKKAKRTTPRSSARPKVPATKATSTLPPKLWKLKVAESVDQLADLLQAEQETLFVVEGVATSWESATVKHKKRVRKVLRPPVACEARAVDLVARPGAHGLASRPSDRIGVLPKVKAAAQRILKSRQDHDLLRHATIATERTFVYFDISDFSRYPAGQQVLVIKSLLQLSGHLLGPRGSGGPRYPGVYCLKDPDCETQLCIGDGYIYVFRDPVAATFFVTQLAGRVQLEGARGRLPIEFHFRAGVHHGPVYHFWDPGRSSWNYIGDGINDASRVLSVIPKDVDDVCYVSDEIRKKLQIAKDSENMTWDGSMRLCSRPTISVLARVCPWPAILAKRRCAPQLQR